MIVVGLCGGSGSGKGCVGAVFENNGFPAIDTDEVYHRLVSSDSECLRELALAFGESIVRDGALNRRALADIVFSGDSSAEKLKTLNEISHKHVLCEARKMIEDYSSSGKRMVVVDAPLLFESGFDKECDVTVAVVADREVRIKRIMDRDNITYPEAERRIAAQRTDDWLRENADKIVENNSDTAALRCEVSGLIKDILNEFGEK